MNLQQLKLQHMNKVLDYAKKKDKKTQIIAITNGINKFKETHKNEL